ncbi:hypothetical protein [uncultured Aliiroseovarius sp.]|uniref:hypothetical protein n=1 Tax=uncultured Aliiroseovarius sp. TaxID=1658783 RepID=UPI0025942B90|nr:hypothetical protein [uncultured Aliiroseovarius sp.]
MSNAVLTRAFALLIAFSIATTFLAGAMPDAGPVFVLTVLVLSGLKSFVILSDYLGLRVARPIRGGFTAFLVGFLGLAAFIYAVPFAM